MPIQWSPEQEEVIKEVAEGSGNLVVNARAGSAKTTTAVEAINHTSAFSEVLCCAFNKRIAVELQEKMPPHAVCKTLNALGHGAWMKRMSGGAKIELDARKNSKIAWSIEGNKDFPDLGQAMGLAKSFGLVPKGNLGDGKGLVEDRQEEWMALFDAFDLDLGICQDPVGMARHALLQSISMAWKGKIDFDDQLYMSAIFKAPFKRNDMVLIDEAQDISPIQRAMLDLMLKPEGRLVAVGDEHQAIYGFRGADQDSINRIREKYSAKELKLTISFRCPQAVVREAQKYVPDIQAWDQSPEGMVRSLKEYEARIFQPGDVILCRNNAPLIALCFKLISKGIGASVIGKEIGVGLIKLVKKLKASSLTDLAVKLEDWRGDQIAKLHAAGRDTRAAAVADKAEAIQHLITAMGQTATVNDLTNMIDRMFNKRQPIELCTIHKSKGLEWKRVYFLDKYLVPSKWAKSESAKIQENNLAYVGVTRSQGELVYIDSKGLKL